MENMENRLKKKDNLSIAYFKIHVNFYMCPLVYVTVNKMLGGGLFVFGQVFLSVGKTSSLFTSVRGEKTTGTSARLKRK